MSIFVATTATLGTILFIYIHLKKQNGEAHHSRLIRCRQLDSDDFARGRWNVKI